MLKPLEGKLSPFITSFLLARVIFHFVWPTANYVLETCLTVRIRTVIHKSKYSFYNELLLVLAVIKAVDYSIFHFLPQIKSVLLHVLKNHWAW